MFDEVMDACRGRRDAAEVQSSEDKHGLANGGWGLEGSFCNFDEQRDEQLQLIVTHFSVLSEGQLLDFF